MKEDKDLVINPDPKFYFPDQSNRKPSNPHLTLQEMLENSVSEID